MTGLRAVWVLAQVAGLGVVAIGVAGRRLHWLYEPWWWVVVIALNVSTVLTFATTGRWIPAALFTGVTFAAIWYLRETVAIHRVRRWLR